VVMDRTSINYLQVISQQELQAWLRRDLLRN